MSDKMRWRYGDTNPVVAAVDSATVIEVGDLLWQGLSCTNPDASGRKAAYPASDIRQDGTEGKVVYFADNFLGVAMYRSQLDDTEPVRVATTGVFEFDCPSGRFELGDLIGVDYELHRGHQTLLNQQVAPMGSSKYAIARVARRVAEPADTVLVDICSTVMRGGIR